MKQLTVIIFAALIISATGCQQENNIVNPESLVSAQDNNQASSPATGLLSKNGKKGKDKYSGSLDLLKVSKVITLDGDKGGHVSYKYEFPDGSTVDADLTLEKRSYKGTKTFTITFDAANKTVHFDPHGSTFDIPAHLDLKYKKLDFENDVLTTGIDWRNAKNGTFVYMPDDGSAYQEMEYKDVIVNANSGILFVKNARLPHFSRFGFIR